MRKLPTELRRHPTSIALSVNALSRLQELSEEMETSRSRIVEDAIGLYYRFFSVYGPDRRDWEDDDPHPPEIPDDVDEIGYNPYTGQYEEDL